MEPVCAWRSQRIREGDTHVSTGRPFISTQFVHFDLVDLLGVVHNAQYFFLFERARTDWIQSHGLWYGSPEFDWPYYVVRNEIDYLAPIFGGVEIDVSVQIDKIGRTSATFHHLIATPDGQKAAEGRTIVVRVDPDSKIPIPWTDRFRRLAESIKRDDP